MRSGGEPSVYLSTARTGTGYGDHVVAVRVDPRLLRIDDEFPGGRADFAIDQSNVPVAAATRDLEQAQPGAQGPRGKISLGDPVAGTRALITLFRDADASTFMHETAHDWLERLVRAATDADAPDRLVRNVETIHEWLGTKAGEPISTEAHEKFATAFEQYLREGKAPTPALQSVFDQFKEWLVKIYQTIAGLGEPINDDIRGVFDRMLATDEQLARARSSQPGVPAGLIGQPVPAMPAHRVATAGGQSVEVTPVVVEARDLIASNDPDYDPALQPRQRDRAASQQQVREIAGALVPERLGMSAEADRGAPIVGDDGMVESGNGRVMALRAAYDADGPAIAAYRDWLTQQGVDVAGFDQPVLVRQRTTPMTTEERADFAVAANRAATLQMSAPERAMADARNLSPEILDLIRNPDNLEAVANRDFVRAFIRSLPQADQGGMATADGGLSTEGLARVRHAILARAYGGTPNGAAILSRIVETTQDDIRSISGALTAAAPLWARLRSDIEAGRVVPEVDLTPELLEAVRRTADLRNRGQTFADFRRQQDAFDVLPPRVEAFMSLFYDPKGTRAAGAQRITEGLKEYAVAAAKVSAERGLDFGLPAVSADDLQQRILRRSTGAGEGGGLFAGERPDVLGGGAGAGAGGAERGAEIRRPGAGGLGTGVGGAGEPGAGRGQAVAGRDRSAPAPGTDERVATPTGPRVEATPPASRAASPAIERAAAAGEPDGPVPADTPAEIAAQAEQLERLRRAPGEGEAAPPAAVVEMEADAEAHASAYERASLCVVGGYA